MPRMREQQDGRRQVLRPLFGGASPVFRPRGLKPLTLTGSDLRVRGGQKYRACLECGLLWSSVDAQKLARVLSRNGTAKTKARLGLGE
ncbi:hypothetical protein ACFLSJ_01050 [Verrucomicrobiota bacterium]